ncbi:MAG: ferric reductase-like transmembrane domain-containing protein [Anaerolineae bacterium]|nr:ferric reductase-like transmembrane domain-containing protein [Anaerolineae bacterium]
MSIERLGMEKDAADPVGMNPVGLAVMLLAAAGCELAAAIVMPTWLPGLSVSLLGEEPKAFWYLARASGVVAYLLLWLSMVFGLVVSNKMARLWNGGPSAVELHQFVTWFAIAFSLFHALILLGDKYIQTSLTQVLTPFAYTGYAPFWVGMGQVMFYLALIVTTSYSIRRHLGHKAWRTLHYASFVLYLGLTLHGIFAGTDTTLPVMLGIYILTGASICLLVIVRIADVLRAPRTARNVAPKTSPLSSTTR